MALTLGSGRFAIDKKANLSSIGQIIGSNFLGQFNFQAPQSPDDRTRMTFRELKTPDGSSLPEVELFIDPKSIQVQKVVLQQKRLTKGGFVIQFWGHDLTQITVNATSGNFQPLYGVELQIPPDVRGKAGESWFNQIRERWIKGGGPLKIFEKMKDWVYQKRFDSLRPWVGNPQVELVWEDSIYKGYFTNFSYNLESNEPFHISYNFGFIILERMDMSWEDIFGTMSVAKVLGDPVGTISKGLKQTTAVAISKGKKEVAKLTSQLPGSGILGKFGDAAKNLVDDLPSKITLW